MLGVWLCLGCRRELGTGQAISRLWSRSVVTGDPMDCSLPGSSVHGIFRARILEWVATAFFRRSSPPRDQTRVSCIVDRRFTTWATGEVLHRVRAVVLGATEVLNKKVNDLSTVRSLACFSKVKLISQTTFFKFVSHSVAFSWAPDAWECICIYLNNCFFTYRTEKFSHYHL